MYQNTVTEYPYVFTSIIYSIDHFLILFDIYLDWTLSSSFLIFHLFIHPHPPPSILLVIYLHLLAPLRIDFSGPPPHTELYPSQRDVIISSLFNHITVLIGPPGTGTCLHSLASDICIRECISYVNSIYLSSFMSIVPCQYVHLFH